MERRYLNLPRLAVSCRAEGDGKTIAGYGAVYYDGTAETEYELWNYPGERCVERIAPGAFDRAVREDDVRALFNHDANLVLGRSTSGTLKLSADATGLAYQIEPPDTQCARDVLAMLGRGDVSGSSFSFRADATTWKQERQGDGWLMIRQLDSVQVGDVGPVTFPAYAGASSGLRSAGGNLEAIRAECEAFKRSRGLPLAARLAQVRARAVEVESR